MAASDYLGTAGNIGQLLAAMAAARANGRLAQGQAQIGHDLAGASIYNTTANATLGKYNSQMNAAMRGPRMAAEDAARGDTLANMQPFSWTGDTKKVGNIPVPQSAGGMTPANFGPATRQAGQELAARGAANVNAPGFAVPDAPTLPTPPTLSPLPEANGLDSVLGTGGALGSLLGALAGGGGPGGASGNIGKLIDDLIHHFKGGGGSSGNGDSSTGQRGGHFDESGNWVPDEGTPIEGGYFDPYGNWTQGSDPENPSNATPIDPNQLPGQADPMAEYLAWLAQQGGGDSSGNPTGSGWGGE